MSFWNSKSRAVRAEQHRQLLVVLIVALVLRVLASLALTAWNPQGLANGDTAGYWRLAQNLADHGIFSRSENSPLVPDAFRTPGYPAFLALFHVLGLGWTAVALVQSFLSCATIALLVKLLNRWFDKRVVLAAAWLVAVDPESVLYAATVAPATLVTFLLLATVFVVASWRRGWGGVVAGLMSGLAALVKPMALYFPLWLAGLLLLDRHSRGRTLRAGLVVLAATVVLFPWLWRNRHVFGVWRFTSIQGFNLLYYNAAALESAERGITVSDAQDSLAAELTRQNPDLGTANELERARAMEHLAVRRILSHPFHYALLHLRGVPTSLLDPGRIDWARVLRLRNPARGFFDILSASSPGELWRFLKRLPWLQTVVLALYGVFLLAVTGLTLVGVWVLAGGKRLLGYATRLAAWVWLVGPLVYLWLITGPIGGARFRVPMWPYVAGLAGLGLWALTELRREQGGAA